MTNAPRWVGTWALPALLALLLAVPAAAPARADEDERRPDLETQIFRIGALTMGKAGFVGEVAAPVSPDAVRDEERPPFGTEWEEPSFPLGQADELIELLKGAVQPAFWESTAGARLQALSEQHLVARASRPVLEEIARTLARFEQEVLGVTRIDVRAVPVEPHQALPADPAESPGGPSLSFVAWSDQQVAATSGRQLAYVADYDTSVAQDSTVSDPMVSIANLGLMVDARATPTGNGDATLVDAWIRLVEMEGPRTAPTGEHRPVEVPAFEVATVHASLEAPAGTWTAAGAGGGWAFFVRATPAPYEAPSLRITPLPEFERTSDDWQKMELRHFIVTDLFTAARPREERASFLWPSRYTPPEPPELPEPQALCGYGSVIRLLRMQGGRETWEDPSTAEVRNGRLIVRNDAGVLAGTERLLDALRKQFLRSVTTTAEVVEMPAALARRLQGTGASTYLLEAAAQRALAEARKQGEARTVARAELLNRPSARNSVAAGRRVSYLQDYEDEIAQGAAIGNPVVCTFFSGFQLDLRAEWTSAGNAVALEVRCMQAAHEEPIREIETPHGPLELPELHVFRVRTSLLVPLGRTAVLAVRGDGDRRQVLLLTPREGRESDR